MKYRESYVIYKSFADALEMLDDEHYGQAMRAINRYAIYGEEPESISTEANIVFTMAKPQIDANIERRENGKKGAEYGKMGGRPKKDTDVIEEKNPIGVSDKNPIGVMSENPIGVSEKTPNVNVNVNENVNNNPPISPLDPIGDSDLTDKVKQALTEWVQYKKERREGYKPTGLKTLIGTAKRYETECGADKVCEAIASSMSSGYKGIMWDRLKGKSPPKSKFNDFKQNSYDYAELEKQLIKN